VEPDKNPMPQWLKLFLAACTGAGLQTGAQTLSVDSPVHFAVDGAAPVVADEWECGPEGGIVGAPMVCRPKSPHLASPVEGRDTQTTKEFDR